MVFGSLTSNQINSEPIKHKRAPSGHGIYIQMKRLINKDQTNQIFLLSPFVWRVILQRLVRLGRVNLHRPAGAFTAIWKPQREAEGDTIMCHSLSAWASSSSIVEQVPHSLRACDYGFRNLPHYKTHYCGGGNLEMLTILAAGQQSGNG